MSTIPDDARPALDVLRSVGGNDMVAMLIRTFLQFARERVGKLGEEARNERWEEVASIAHSIKSSARQLGANAFGDACATAEECGRKGDIAGASAGVTAIEREFAVAYEWMRTLTGGTPA